MASQTDDGVSRLPIAAGEVFAERVEKESRPSPIDVHVGARIRLRRTAHIRYAAAARRVRTRNLRA